MKKIRAKLSMGLSGCNQTTTLEVEDDLTDEEIDQIVQDWAHEHVDYSWSPVD